MTEPQREMTLQEWCDRLPECHLVNREYKSLVARVKKLEAVLMKIRDNPKGTYNEYVDEIARKALEE